MPWNVTSPPTILAAAVQPAPTDPIDVRLMYALVTTCLTLVQAHAVKSEDAVQLVDLFKQWKAHHEAEDAWAKNELAKLDNALAISAAVTP